MSSYLYSQAYQATIQSSFEPNKKNQFQTWLTEKFIQDPRPFIIKVKGQKVEVSRLRVAALWVEMGKTYKEISNTSRIPQDFLNSHVIPELTRQFGG